VDRYTQNASGVKDQIDCYRTVNGERYISWVNYFDKELISAYRAAGAMVRKFGNGIYVRESDKEIVQKVDAR
jgi:hypothetical protein